MDTSLDKPSEAIGGHEIPAPQRGVVRLWLAELRAQQWAKNLLVCAPLIFSLRLGSPGAVVRSFFAFILFSAVSSAGYLLNDINDLEQDRLHPLKRHRPLAAGTLSISRAWFVAVALVALALPSSLLLAPGFAILLGAHFALNCAYTFTLKRIVLVELLAVTFGFVLRALAGAAAINVTASGWLIGCTTVVALLVGFGKRRQELLWLGEKAARHRRVLGSYSPLFLEIALLITATLAIVCYTLYAISDLTLERFHSRALLLTLPFVVVGICRYVFLVFKGNRSSDPIELIRTDRVTAVNLLLWFVTVVIVLYFP